MTRRIMGIKTRNRNKSLKTLRRKKSAKEPWEEPWESEERAALVGKKRKLKKKENKTESKLENDEITIEVVITEGTFKCPWSQKKFDCPFKK